MASHSFSTSLVLCMLAGPLFVQSHVGLTFPPARKYDLDFLDNARTKPPCGMPKGEVRTTIRAGSKFNVTWHLGYPHQGGFRLELLDSEENPIRELTSAGKGNYVTGDTTAQAFLVDIPSDLECTDCTIRLLRQALEWSKKYIFWSCADVDIVPPAKYREECSGHGKPNAGRCRCDRLYYGDRCQYRDECLKDEDCGLHGKCFDIEATTAPRKQCFCQHGFFGAGCAEKSPIKKKEINEGLYTKREINPSMTIFWRILREVNEIEIAIRAKGTGYVGLGWRPKSVTKQCQRFPKLGDEPEDEAAEGEEGAAEPESNAGSEPETSPEPETEPEPETTSEDAIEKETIEQGGSVRRARTVRKSIDVSIGYVTSSVTSDRKRRQAEDEDSVVPVLEESEALEESEDTTPSPEPETTTSKSESAEEGTAEPEGSADSDVDHPDHEEGQAEPEVKGKGVTSFTPRGEFHAMDCVDMVIGMARGDSSRIWDYYTRDRSTPRRDTFWGGTNDVTGALGFERDGETTIIFRKKMKANDFTDHDILNEDMHVIWAVGQEPGAYSHSPNSGLEAGTPSVPDFYKSDELKYHGKKNRGSLTMNFFEEVKQGIGKDAGDVLDFCGGEWKFPRDCNPTAKTCDYFARWIFDEDADKIHFTVQTKHTELWTGIGFSDTPEMTLTDAVIGFVETNGRFFIMDMWITNYLMPILESSQDLTNLEGIQEDGITTLKFSRARNTNDKHDVAFTDDSPKYLIFPVKGGRFNAVNKKLHQHEETPIPSSEKIFIRPCRTADGKPTFTTTPKPAQIMYTGTVKFIELGERYTLPTTGTKEYTDLVTKVAKSLQESTLLPEVPGFSDVTVTKLSSDQRGEFIAEMIVVVDKVAYEGKEPSEKTVEDALKETVESGKIGQLSVDPKSLQLRAPVHVEASRGPGAGDDSEGGILSSTKLYIIIACIVALLFIALVQATCTIYRITRKSPAAATMAGPTHAHKDKLGQSAWKDYSANGGHHTNYAYEPFEHGQNNDDNIKRHMRSPPMAAMPPMQQHQQQQHHNNGTLPRPMMAAGRNGAPLPPHPRGARGPPPPNAGGPGYSLPRPNSAYGSAGSYGSYDRRIGYGGSAGGPPLPGHHPAGGSDFAPDHYFMPSQRKYSGEFLRVYVDYNK